MKTTAKKTTAKKTTAKKTTAKKTTAKKTKTASAETTFHKLPGAKWTRVPTDEAAETYDIMEASNDSIGWRSCSATTRSTSPCTRGT